MNETPNEEEKKNQPITDAGHLLEPDVEEESTTIAAPGSSATESPVRQLQNEADAGATAPAPSSIDNEKGHGGGVLVLQWLSYAFWFWFSLSVSWLAGVVISYLISGSNYVQNELLAYSLASVIIMLIVALVTDVFYAKYEPVRKTGGANVIMLLHVVPFILIAIGALVTVVFALIRMLLNADPVASTDGPVQVMLVGGVVALLFALAAGRAFYGHRKRVRFGILGVFIALAIGFIIAAFAAPAADAIRTKQDRLIEQGLPSLATDIRNYAEKNDKLPATLGDVTHEDSYSADVVQKIINDKLVTYKANTLPTSTGNSYSPGEAPDSPVAAMDTGVSYRLGSTKVKRFYYQLCTKFQNEKKSEYNYSENSANYTTDLSAGVKSSYRYSYVTTISSHPAGEVCYNLYADGKYNYGTLEPADKLVE